jgi:hypothetical protein
MAELKTKPTKSSVDKFLKCIEDDQRREDCIAVAAMMQQITKSEPKMWGPSIVGFGQYRYKYDSGREGDWFLTGFSPRKQSLTLYIMAGFSEYDALMKALGKHKTGKSCLYVNRLEDIHAPTLKKLIQQSVAHMRKISA